MPVTPVLIIHIAVGTICLLSGFAALIFRKGSQQHRRAGKFFVISTVAAAVTAVYLAIFTPEKMISVIGGVIAFYLVITGWLTVARKPANSLLIDLGLLVLPLAAGIGAINLGLVAAGNESGLKEGLPPGAYYFWASTAAVCVGLDIKVILNGGVSGKVRISRHIWRMCFALFIAEAAFVLGQQHVFPEMLRNTYLLVAPLLLVIIVMIFWLFRMRFSKSSVSNRH